MSLGINWPAKPNQQRARFGLWRADLAPTIEDAKGLPKN